MLIGTFLFICGFYLGGYTSAADWLHSRFEIIGRLNFSLIYNYFSGLTSKPKKMAIDIKHKNYQYIEYKRAEALKRGVIITDESAYVPARVVVDGQSHKVKIRLKGDITDHLAGEKWSFRIKVRGDNAVWGMRRFSLQAPERSGWGHEWVMYEWFKKEDCWKSVRALGLKVPESLQKALIHKSTVTASGGRKKKSRTKTLSAEDVTNIARCKERSANDWHRVIQWGSETGELAEWEIGIASTLSGYAANNWAREPSAKQAKHGAKILARCEHLFSGH